MGLDVLHLLTRGVRFSSQWQRYRRVQLDSETRKSPRQLVEWYVPRCRPVDDRLRRIPRAGRFLRVPAPCWNTAGLSEPREEERAAWRTVHVNAGRPA